MVNNKTSDRSAVPHRCQVEPHTIYQKRSSSYRSFFFSHLSCIFLLLSGTNSSETCASTGLTVLGHPSSGVLIAGVLICGSLAGNKWNKPITHMYERIFHFHGCISANESSLTDFTSLWQLFDAFLLRHSLLVHLAPDMTTTGLITYFIFTGFLTWNSLEVTLEFKPNSPLSLLAFQY